MTSVSSSQTNWKTMRISGVQRIERVVAEFSIECSYIPSRYFRVKVIEDDKGNYVGRMNVSVKNAGDDSPEWIVGLGNNIDTALEDAIGQFMRLLDNCGKDKHQLTEEDFEWTTCEDF